jgi:sec-independent protein translocase protein TatC
MGCGVAYYLTIPLSNQYLMVFNASIAQNMWGLSEYLDYTFTLMLAHGFAFECGVLLFICVHLGILKASTLVSYRRYAIFGAFVLGALLTPPDVFSQVMLALPLIGFYEIAIWYAKSRNYLTRT